VYCAISESEVMALKAVEDQILRRPRSMAMMAMRKIARTGI